MPGTALSQVHIALVGALDGDAQLDTALGVYASRPHKVFNGGDVPQGMLLPYIVVGEAGDAPSTIESFDTERLDGRTRLHLWTGPYAADGQPAGTVRGLNALAIDTLYAHVRRLLHRQRLVMTNYRMSISGNVNLITAFVDEDGGAMHGIVDYSYTTEVYP